MQQNLTSCADCRQFPDASLCGKFNNLVSKLFAFVFRSDRAACIRQIREIGIQGHADNMCDQKRHTIKR